MYSEVYAPMKVAIITPTYLPEVSGGVIHIYNLTKYLVKHKYEVEIITSSPKYISHIKNPMSVSNTFNDANVEVARKFKDWIFIKDADIINIQSLPPLSTKNGLWLEFAFPLLYSKKPIVFTPHGNVQIIELIKSPVLRSIALTGRKNILKVSKKIIAVCEYERNQILKIYDNPSKVQVIPNGVNELLFEMPPTENEFTHLKPYYIMVARIIKTKNMHMAIEALSKIRDPELRLIIVGQVQEEYYYEQLLDLVKKLGLDSRVIFYGYVDEITKVKLIDNSLGLIHLGLENDSLAVKEAFSRGKPVIALNQAGLPHIVKNGTNGFVINNVEELAERMLLLFQDNKLLAKIGENNKTLARSFTWENVAKAYMKVYEEVYNSD